MTAERYTQQIWILLAESFSSVFGFILGCMTQKAPIGRHFIDISLCFREGCKTHVAVREVATRNTTVWELVRRLGRARGVCASRGHAGVVPGSLCHAGGTSACQG